MKKTVYKILWSVSILLLAAILCSSGFMFANGGGVGVDFGDIAEEDDETTKRHTNIKNPSIVTSAPADVTEPAIQTTEIIIQPSPPDVPDNNYEDSKNLGLKLNDKGTEYAVVGIGTCKDTFIVIPSEYKGLPITSISYRAFTDNAEIEGVVIPGSVKTIETAAFQGCVRLRTLVLSEGIYSIGASAFQKCESLESFVLPRTAQDIKTTAFKDCVSLKSVTLPEGFKKLNNGVFAGCVGLSEVSLPSTMTYICKRAFADCSNLEAINFNGTVDYVGEHASWWDGIVFESNWDQGTGNYTVYCIDGTIK